MSNTKWRYYNHAMIPTGAPHEEVDADCIYDGRIWNMAPSGKKPLLIQWTSDFDCGKETQWWYVIKDTPFDISKINAKRRYVINRGTKNFDVHIINPADYKEELYEVQIAAFSAYPKKYRPTVDKETFLKNLYKWDNYIVYGAFLRETGKLCGYAMLLSNNDKVIDYQGHKSDPQYEKMQVNAAIVYQILLDYNKALENGELYICDGWRSINHETAFQDYLEKYFQFRKAYCKLNIVYSPKVEKIIKFICPFKKILKLFDFIGIVHAVNSVLKYEDIIRMQK